VVSQWKVESASTTELMTAFHRGLAGGEGAKADHLRQAGLALLRQPRYAHPFYWAPFVLVGDPY
jgi:CHAT domain-containing protein